MGWKTEDAEPCWSYFNQEYSGYKVPPLFLALPESQVPMAGQESGIAAGMGVGMRCPPAWAATSATHRINLASLGTTRKRRRYLGSAFLQTHTL